MKIHFDCVSASVAGDYYQVMFHDDSEEEGDGMPDAPYVLIQRQFEMADGGRIYIETHDEDYIGHFAVTRSVLGPKELSLHLRRKRAAELEVTFNASRRDYMALKEALQTMIPNIELAEAS
jgi:hypothetical protein